MEQRVDISRGLRRFFHGGAAGRGVGDFILPPETSGARSTAEFGAGGVCRTDRVYVTTSYEAACMYAAMSPGGSVVYEVQPFGELGDDPDCTQPGLSFECAKAWVLAVHELEPKDVRRIRRAVMG